MAYWPRIPAWFALGSRLGPFVWSWVLGYAPCSLRLLQRRWGCLWCSFSLKSTRDSIRLRHDVRWRRRRRLGRGGRWFDQHSGLGGRALRRNDAFADRNARAFGGRIIVARAGIITLGRAAVLVGRALLIGAARGAFIAFNGNLVIRTFFRPDAPP